MARTKRTPRVTNSKPAKKGSVQKTAPAPKAKKAIRKQEPTPSKPTLGNVKRSRGKKEVVKQVKDKNDVVKEDLEPKNRENLEETNAKM